MQNKKKSYNPWRELRNMHPVTVRLPSVNMSPAHVLPSDSGDTALVNFSSSRIFPASAQRSLVDKR